MKFGKIDFLSKKLVRTNLHLFQYQRDYYMKKGVGLAKRVRELLDEDIFRDMDGKNPTERLEEAKREVEVAQLLYDEEKKQLEEMQKKIGSIQTTLERFIKAEAEDRITVEAYDKITKEYGIDWRNFEECADKFRETGKIDWDLIFSMSEDSGEMV